MVKMQIRKKIKVEYQKILHTKNLTQIVQILNCNFYPSLLKFRNIDVN